MSERRDIDSLWLRKADIAGQKSFNERRGEDLGFSP